MDINDRRKQARYDYPYTIEFRLRSSLGQENLKGVTINLSRTGLCMYMFRSIGESQEIVFNNSFPIRAKTASIRWIEKIDDDFYKAGLAFV